MEGDLKTNSKFVTKTKIRRKQQPTQKSNFQTTGGNNFLQIQPAIVEFSGFEIGKLYTLPLKIINRANVPQRITVLPLQSSTFNIKVDKKGQIPTGMAEIVTVEFIPNEYFSDYLNIKTETQNFQVPIHGYPILMPKDQISRIIPKIIDFGTLNVGETETNVYVIPSNVPINFQFQFVYKKQCPQITIQPMKGVIQSYQSKQIQISFNALKKITSSAQVFFNINQYGFDPILINILGTGKQKQLKPVRPKSSKNQKQMNNSITNSNLNKNKPLLQSKRLSLKSSIKDDSKDILKDAKDPGMQFKQSVKDFTKSIAPSLPRRPESARRFTATLNTKISLLQTLQQTSNMNQNEKRKKQKQFLQHYNEVFNTDKQKQIKFAIYFGDTPLTQQQINEVKEQRVNEKYEYLKQIQNSCTNRHFIQQNKSLVAINYNNYVRAVPTFNVSKNDVLKKRQKILQRFNIAASKVVVINRMMKRLRKIQEHINRQRGNQKKSETITTKYSSRIDSIIDTIQFKVNQNRFKLESFKLQFQESGTMNQQQFQVKATTQFDDSAPLELLEGFQPEIMGYDKLPFPTSYINPPVLPPASRGGAQEEYPTRGAGVPIPQIPQKLSVYSLPPKLPFYRYILQHPTIKFVQKSQLNNQNSLDYLFQNINRIDDQYEGWSDGDRDALRYKFMKSIDVPYLTVNGKIGTDNIYDVGFLKDIHQYCPKHLDTAQPDDPFSDQDSDNEQYPTLPVSSKQQFGKKLEGDNKQLQAKRQKVTNELQQDLKLIDQNLKAIKISALSVIPSTLNDFNKRTQAKQDKLIII